MMQTIKTLLRTVTDTQMAVAAGVAQPAPSNQPGGVRWLLTSTHLSRVLECTLAAVAMGTGSTLPIATMGVAGMMAATMMANSAYELRTGKESPTGLALETAIRMGNALLREPAEIALIRPTLFLYHQLKTYMQVLAVRQQELPPLVGSPHSIVSISSSAPTPEVPALGDENEMHQEDTTQNRSGTPERAESTDFSYSESRGSSSSSAAVSEEQNLSIPHLHLLQGALPLPAKNPGEVGDFSAQVAAAARMRMMHEQNNPQGGHGAEYTPILQDLARQDAQRSYLVASPPENQATTASVVPEQQPIAPRRQLRLQEEESEEEGLSSGALVSSNVAGPASGSSSAGGGAEQSQGTEVGVNLRTPGKAGTRWRLASLEAKQRLEALIGPPEALPSIEEVETVRLELLRIKEKQQALTALIGPPDALPSIEEVRAVESALRVEQQARASASVKSVLSI